MENESQPKILLVDDIKMFLEIQRNMLEALPVEVLTATDGDQALRMVDEFGPDLIVLDANMPGMDGVTCCSTLKQHARHRRIPVIMTVPNCADTDELCRAAGCEAVLRKPLDTGVFLDAVACFIPLVERRDRRVEVLIPITVRSEGGEFTGAIINLSRSGAMIEPDEPVRIGDLLQLAFVLPAAGSSRYLLRAKVVRQFRGDLNGMQSGVGVSFVTDNGDYLRLPESSPLCRHFRLTRRRK